MVTLLVMRLWDAAMPRSSDMLMPTPLSYAWSRLATEYEVLLRSIPEPLLFLTVSPVVAGRRDATRLGMVEGVELLPSRGVWSRLLSARRHGDYLFLRYGLRA